MSQTTILDTLIEIDGKTQTLDAEGAAFTEKPTVIAGKYSQGLGLFNVNALTATYGGADGDGNPIYALAVKDYSAGSSHAESYTFDTSHTEFFSAIGAQSVFIDVSGTWTGSLTVQAQSGPSPYALKVRLGGTLTMLDAITANGVYEVVGEDLDNLNIIGTIGSGEADAYVLSLLFPTDTYVHVAEQACANSAVTSVNSANTNVTLLSANAGRKGAIFYNDSTATCYVKFGTTASTSSFTVKMLTLTAYELSLPTYQGRIDAIWASANGAMRITELT